MRVAFILILALMVTSPGASATGGGDVVHGGWTLESDKDGIKIYTREVRGSKLKQVRAVVSVFATMEIVVRALTDYPNYYKWMNNVTESYVVDHPADSVHYVYRFEDAPWPATRLELIDYADRTGAPLEVIDNLEAMEDDGEPYESIEEVWPDFPTKDDDFYFEDE